MAVLGICFWLYSDYLRVNAKAYKDAISLVEEKKYEEARGEFLNLGSFKDSARWLEEIQSRREKDLLEQGQYQQARSYLDQLPQDYEGKEELLLKATVIEAGQKAEQGEAPEFEEKEKVDTVF